ncbi:hypothetical protein JHK82_015984 [Glycine max]|nr:hypothetical protein JHK85_016383 [Glycine max]KAG5149103.1 hypothetical protein JHK82_015984 [Glycine max]
MSTQSSIFSNVAPSNSMARTRFTAAFRVHKNIIEVLLTYHRQWRPYYPTYVLFDYNGTKHFVKVCKYGTRCFFADGLKEFRRTHGINDSVIIRFFAASKDTSFEVDIMGPILRQTCRRSVVTTRRHIFTADVTQDMIEHTNPLVGVLPATALNFLFGSKKYVPVQRPSGRRNQWQSTVHNGLPSVADP